jgi:uncharacterized protein (DUF1499 family)
MINEPTPIYSPFARWSRRIAVFSVQLVVVAVVLHRFMALSTPVALNLFVTALVGAAIAVLLALGAYIAIWRDARRGVASASLGLVLGLGLFAWPVALVPLYRSMPKLADVTTDMTVPPSFVALAAARSASWNGPDYAGPAAARIQQDSYPDIRPVIVPRPVTETWEVLDQTVKRLGWKVSSEQPPAGRGQPGYIEAVDRTLVLGFHDDIVIRIDGDARETRVDVRSASRYGEHDFGRNAARIRRLFKELAARLEETVAGAERPRRRRGRPDAAVPKRLKGAPALSQSRRPSQDRARRGSPREPQPTATRPARAADRGRDTRSRQSQE